MRCTSTCNMEQAGFKNLAIECTQYLIIRVRNGVPLAEFKRQFSHVTCRNSKLALYLQLTTRQTTRLRRRNTQWVSRSRVFFPTCSKTGKCVSIILAIVPLTPIDVAIFTRYFDGMGVQYPLPRTSLSTHLCRLASTLPVKPPFSTSLSSARL